MTRVWYAAYGSNMSSARLGCYLSGGRPEGGSRTYPGSRDPAPPVRSVGAEIPGELVFGGTSQTWGGGVAFLVPDTSHITLAHLVEVAWDQVLDVMAQENWLDPGAIEVGSPPASVEVVDPELRYGTLVPLGDREGLPVVTFTKDPDHPPAAPARAYLRYVAEGLAEAFGFDARASAHYLADKRGIRGVLDVDELEALLR